MSRLLLTELQQRAEPDKGSALGAAGVASPAVPNNPASTTQESPGCGGPVAPCASHSPDSTLQQGATVVPYEHSVVTSLAGDEPLRRATAVAVHPDDACAADVGGSPAPEYLSFIRDYEREKRTAAAARRAEFLMHHDRPLHSYVDRVLFK